MLSWKNAILTSINSLNSRDNMLHAEYAKYQLIFKFEARTSRSVMNAKDTYFIKICDDKNPDCVGIGECALFKGLSAEDVPDYESVLKAVCADIENASDSINYSSIKFGVETALLDLKNGGTREIFHGRWADGEDEIPINGLIWMGDKKLMFNRIKEKIDKGFRCIKLKIGGINFDDELSLIQYIRSQFNKSELELRLDANGAFTPDNALCKIDRLSQYHIHSLEQPIKPNQREAMAEICQKTAIPIALDEELIGWWTQAAQANLLEEIRPQYIILKPSLCGGFGLAKQWIDIANGMGIGWWATSALESNIGLNAIAQWVSTLNTNMPQGLGTGNLYLNNIQSPLIQERNIIKKDITKKWVIPNLQWQK